jgi:alpha-L-arabinofuranosidase
MKLSNSLLLLLAAGPAVTASEPAQFAVTTNLLAAKPISPRLYGNFIELGYGVQVEPMMAQMFFNRSFEPFTPYKTINIEWFDLWNKPGDPGKGYKTDWTGEDWYHSGYEHNPWFVAPGTGGRLPIDDRSTFIITNGIGVSATLTPLRGGSGHGTQHLLVQNHESSRWAGLGQEGKFFRKGETYRFRGLFRSVSGSSKAEIRFYATGDWSRPIAVLPLKEFGNEWSKRQVSYRNTRHEGWTTFALLLPPGAAVLVDDFSLLPKDQFHGWRSDILEPLKQIGPTVLRVPGGCFASFYDWRDGVGPLSQRKPQPSYFWGGQNYNDVGVAELALLARAIDSEVMYCLNVFHPLKKDYEWYFGPDSVPPGPHGRNFQKFTDIGQGAKEAADLVAYCNLPANKHPLAKLRASHGVRKPFGIRFWELDNEVHRWFEPEEYARSAVEYSRAMKAVDPSIQIGLVTYGERINADHKPRVTYHERVPAMLDIAGQHIDFLADRGPSAREYLQQIIGWMNDYNRQHGTRIRYCETEKLFYEQFPDVENRIRPTDGYSKSFMFSKWFYAMKAIMDYMAYQRAGGDIDFVIFNNLANTHSQCVIDTPKEGVFITAAGIAMSQLAHSPAAWPLQFEGYEARFDDNFQVSAAWDRDRKRLVLYILNRTAQSRPAHFDLRSLGREFRRTHATALCAQDPFVMNTLANPDAIKREVLQSTRLAGAAEHQVTARPWSFTEIILE